MKAEFSIASPIPSCGTAPGHRGRVMPPAGARAPESIAPVARATIALSRYQLAEALMTLAVMALFSGALAGMLGELQGAPSAPAARPAATGDLPHAPPQALRRLDLASMRGDAIANA
jgi:hypothetical protein